MSNGPGHGPGEGQTKPGTRPGKLWTLALVGLIGTFAVLACYDLISSGGVLHAGPATAAVGTEAPKGSPSGTGSSSSAASANPASVTPAGTVGSTAPSPLAVTSVVAFGPEGTSDGDHPDLAPLVLDRNADQPWHTSWYATPEFGDLRSGTGLLLTLGAPATVRDVRLVLGSAPGADVQVRVGNSPSPDLPVVASATGAGGTVRLTATAAATGRYVLIWFTRLPPDGLGHYQADVYHVLVDG